MSQNPITPVHEGEAPAAPVQPSGPFKNPSYPRRVHVHEKAHWQGVLKACEEKVTEVGQRLAALGNPPNRASYDRLYAQLQGARDQVADAARRLPGEVGDLYHEDHHRLEEAVAAIDRIIKAWDAL